MIVNEVRVKEIANPAAVGWQWLTDDIKHEITWVRGSSKLSYSVNGERGWVSTSLDNPGRFGFTGSLKSARRAVEAFLKGEGEA